MKICRKIACSHSTFQIREPANCFLLESNSRPTEKSPSDVTDLKLFSSSFARICKSCTIKYSFFVRHLKKVKSLSTGMPRFSTLGFQLCFKSSTGSRSRVPNSTATKLLQFEQI